VVEIRRMGGGLERVERSSCFKVRHRVHPTIGEYSKEAVQTPDSAGVDLIVPNARSWCIKETHVEFNYAYYT
jgi:hypothetical protein